MSLKILSLEKGKVSDATLSPSQLDPENEFILQEYDIIMKKLDHKVF